MGAAYFRVGGRIFATLAAEKLGYGNVKLTQELQKEFVAEQPEIFLPIKGWEKTGMTHIVLANANRELLTDALRLAWKLRVELNAQKKTAAPRKRKAAAKKH